MDIQYRETPSKTTFFFLIALEERAFRKDDLSQPQKQPKWPYSLFTTYTHIFVEMGNPLQQPNVFKGHCLSNSTTKNFSLGEK